MAFATAEFRAGESEVGAQHPEQRSLGVRIQLHGFAIKFE
jgi:hypothetical protein